MRSGERGDGSQGGVNVKIIVVVVYVGRVIRRTRIRHEVTRVPKVSVRQVNTARAAGAGRGAGGNTSLLGIISYSSRFEEAIVLAKRGYLAQMLA